MAATFSGFLVAIGMQSFGQYLSCHLKTSNTYMQTNQLIGLRMFLATAVDCTKTFTLIGSGCPTSVALYDKNGGVVVASTTPLTQVGPFEVRSKCTSSGVTARQLPIEVRKTGTTTWKSLNSVSVCQVN